MELFKDHPEMGLWRNEDDAHSVQLTEEEDVIQIANISFVFPGVEEIRQHIEEIYPHKTSSEMPGLERAEGEPMDGTSSDGARP